MMRSAQATVMAIAGAALLALSACGSAPEVEAEARSHEVAPESTPSENPVVDVPSRSTDTDYECGQVSILTFLELRLTSNFWNAEGDPDVAAAQQQMLNDLWQSIVPQESEVSDLVVKAQKAAAANDPDTLSAVAEEIRSKCTANGTPLEMMALPGEGG